MPQASVRDALFGLLGQTPSLQNLLHVTSGEARRIQVESLLDCCSMAQKQGTTRDFLATATYL